MVLTAFGFVLADLQRSLGLSQLDTEFVEREVTLAEAEVEPVGHGGGAAGPREEVPR